MRCTAIALLMLSSCSSSTIEPQQPFDRPLRIATWNLEHLAERDGDGCRPRAEADYAALRTHADAIGADIVAFQEVESQGAAERVFPPANWRVVIEQRQAGAQGSCRDRPGQTLRAQKVGFAIRRSLSFKRNGDLRELGLGNAGLRWGVDITVDGPTPIRLLALHLKSGCNSGRASSDRDCGVLFGQLPVLERWIDTRAREGRPFAVLGDWNRRVASRGDAFWAEIDDGDPAAADLSLAAAGRGATCKSRYTEFIDHIALDKLAAAHALPGSFREYTYSLPEEQHPSDHCPVSVEIRAP